MKLSAPKGLIAIAAIQIFSSVASARYLAKADAKMIFFGRILSGIEFKTYFSVILLLNFIIGVGILYRQRWSFFSFFWISGWYVIVGVSNFFFTTTEMVVAAGWKGTSSLTSFRVLQLFGVALSAAMVVWLNRYKDGFQKQR